MSIPKYRPESPLAITDLIEGLSQFCNATDHEFWSAEVSLRNHSVINPNYILGTKTITDIWLLAMAVQNNGRLITFDQKIATQAISGANSKHLCVINSQ